MSDKAKDKIGNNIAIGDKVVFMQVGYRNLLIGEISKISPKTILISHPKTNTGDTETRQFHNQVVKHR